MSLAVLLTGSSCQPGPTGASFVFFVMIDTARADRFGAWGYPRPTTPNLDRLAADGVVFLKHYALASATRSSLPSVLYSRYFVPPIFPLDRRVPLASPDDLFRVPDVQAISLPEAMRAAGYSTVMISAHPWLKPETPMARRFDEVHDLSERNEADPRFPTARAEVVIDHTLRWMRQRRNGKWFVYLHLMDVHAPRFADEETAMFLEPEDRFEGWEGYADAVFTNRPPEPKEAPLLDAIYDGALRSVDHHLGRLFSDLRRRAALDQTLIVVTSDHGEMLYQRGEMLTHGGPLYEGLAHVPLIVHHPTRLSPRRFDGLTEAVDVLPTMLDLLDIDLSGFTMDGISLAEPTTARREFAVSPYGVRETRYRLVLRTAPEEILGPASLADESIEAELYDLQNDPRETNDLRDEHPEITDRLLSAYRSRLAAGYERYQRARTTTQPAGDFAIAASHFDVSGQHGDESPERCQQSRHYKRYYLRCLRGAEAVRIEFPLPDGQYDVSASMQGSLRIRIEQTEPLSLQADQPGLYEWGRVHVQDARFAAVLEPNGLPFEIHYLGFRPVPKDRQPLEDDTERTERLRALGYVN